MKIHPILLLYLGVLLSGCHKGSEEIIAPRPAWKLRTDIFLDNKILLGAHATDKRLIVAYTGGFFEMGATDTSFIQYYKGGGGTLQAFGGRVTRSLFGPILSNTLYAGLSNEKDAIAIVDVLDKRDSTIYYAQYNGGGAFYVPTEVGIPTAQVNTYITRFGAYNELTKTLLYTIIDANDHNDNTNKRTVVMNKKEVSPYFAYRNGSTPYRTDIAGTFQATASIAVQDHFIVTPGYSFFINDTYVYAVDAKTGSFKKIPVNFNPPNTYFVYNNHLYGNNTYSGELVRSDDGGFTWRKLGSLSGPSNFTVINGNLIGYGLSQVFWLDDGSETFSNFRELTNDGLDFSQITGIAAFNNKVFATTLSGLYAIDAKDFFTLKQKM